MAVTGPPPSGVVPEMFEPSMLRLEVNFPRWVSCVLLTTELPLVLPPARASISIEAEFPMVAAVAVSEPRVSLALMFRLAEPFFQLSWKLLTVELPPSDAEKEFAIDAEVIETSSVTFERFALIVARVSAQLD